MKKRYKIGLFFVGMLILTLIVIIIVRRNTLDDIKYKDEYVDKNKINNESLAESYSEYSQVDLIDQKTNCDTVIIYQDIDQKDGIINYSEIQIPAKYMNMTRTELENALEEDSKYLSLEDRQKGFISQYLDSFSTEKVRIVRIFDTTSEKTGYYMMAVDHYIWIYNVDKKTLYFKTDLCLEDLPEDVQQEIIFGKYMSNELEVYNFLESYSS